MINNTKNDAEKIISSLKKAKNTIDVDNTLNGVKHLTTTAKKVFLKRITSTGLTKEFHLAFMNNTDKKFHVLHVKAINNIITADKPEFKVIVSNNNKINKIKPLKK